MISGAVLSRAAAAVSGSSASHPTSTCTVWGSYEFVTKEPIDRTSDTGRPRDGRSTQMRIEHRLILASRKHLTLFYCDWHFIAITIDYNSLKHSGLCLNFEV